MFKLTLYLSLLNLLIVPAALLNLLLCNYLKRFEIHTRYEIHTSSIRPLSQEFTLMIRVALVAIYIQVSLVAFLWFVLFLKSGAGDEWLTHVPDLFFPTVSSIVYLSVAWVIALAPKYFSGWKRPTVLAVAVASAVIVGLSFLRADYLERSESFPSIRQAISREWRSPRDPRVADSVVREPVVFFEISDAGALLSRHYGEAHYRLARSEAETRSVVVIDKWAKVVRTYGNAGPDCVWMFQVRAYSWPELQLLARSKVLFGSDPVPHAGLAAANPHFGREPWSETDTFIESLFP